MKQLHERVIQAYSQVHTPQMYTNDDNVSFDGSQRQSEFFRAWDCIQEYYERNKPSKLSFLEVGAWKGLWGIAFVEFCRLNSIEGEYTTITLINHDPGNIPLYATFNYAKAHGVQANLVDMNTLDDQALPAVKKYGKSFNIVFIDAGHEYREAANDIAKFGNLATDLLMFHDIRPISATEICGVYQAIQDAGIELDEEISVVESQMGIGIKYIK